MSLLTNLQLSIYRLSNYTWIFVSFLHNSVRFYGISFVNTPFDSPFNALTKVFSSQFDQRKRSVANSGKTRTLHKMAPTPAVRFRHFAAERFKLPLPTQK